jgi:hypothetical protein
MNMSGTLPSAPCVILYPDKVEIFDTGQSPLTVTCDGDTFWALEMYAKTYAKILGVTFIDRRKPRAAN